MKKEFEISPKAKGLPGFMAILHIRSLPSASTAGLTKSASPTDTPPEVTTTSHSPAAWRSTCRVASRLSGISSNSRSIPQTFGSIPGGIEMCRGRCGICGRAGMIGRRCGGICCAARPVPNRPDWRASSVCSNSTPARCTPRANRYLSLAQRPIATPRAGQRMAAAADGEDPPHLVLIRVMVCTVLFL